MRYGTIAGVLCALAISACNHGNDKSSTTPTNGTGDDTNLGNGSPGSSDPNINQGDMQGTGGNGSNGGPGASGASSTGAGPTSTNDANSNPIERNLLATGYGGAWGGGGKSGK